MKLVSLSKTLACKTQKCPPIVLLPGWGFSTEVWLPLEETLSSLAEVRVLELHYHSEQPEDYVAALAELLSEPSILVGWSLGGMLAVQVAAENPEKVAGLVTLGSNLQFVASEQWPYAMPADTFSAFQSGLKKNPARQLKRFAQLTAMGSPENPLRWLQSCLLADRSEEELQRGLALLHKLDLRSAIETLSSPTLSFFGEQDALVPVAAARALPAKANLKVNTIKSGHCLHQPTSLIEAELTDFLASLKQAR